MATSTFSVEEIQERTRTTEQVAREAAEKREKVNVHLDEILSKEPLEDLEFAGVAEDFRTAQEGAERLERNVTTMIVGMEAITESLDAEFARMSQPTLGEKLVGLLSRRRAAAMQEDRVRSAPIEDKLGSLMRASENVATELERQKAVLADEQTTTVEQQAKVLNKAEEVAKERTELQGTKDRLQAEINDLDSRIAQAPEQKRRELETERAARTNELNAALTREQELVALAQSLERFGEQFATYVESLQNQISRQNVLITKLRNDTEQRQVLYSALTESLKTATMQNAAAKIDAMATETDAQGEETMAKLGAAAQQETIALGEKHATYMRRSAEVQRKSAAADRDFTARFGAIIKELEEGRYEADGR